MELARTIDGSAASDASRKSGSGDMSVAHKTSSWVYYDKMSFLKPYIYAKKVKVLIIIKFKILCDARCFIHISVV